MHVIQYQKPNPATDNYWLDIKIYDAGGFAIGEVNGVDAVWTSPAHFRTF